MLLARAAGSSRAALAERFQQLVGSAPTARRRRRQSVREHVS
jgi:hypothetical protein